MQTMYTHVSKCKNDKIKERGKKIDGNKFKYIDASKIQVLLHMFNKWLIDS
jgi:hypothetical protein